MTLRGVRAGFTVSLVVLTLAAAAEALAGTRPRHDLPSANQYEAEFQDSLWKMLAEVRRITEVPDGL